MALRKIIQDGDEILRKKSFAVTKFDNNLHALLKDMKDTVLSEQGAGLAAPQVGILRRIAVINLEEGYFELINPKIICSGGEQTGYEGCLSVRGKRGIVTRPNNVEVVAQDRHGKEFKLSGEGLFARAVCHELDHLDGILYTDIAKSVEADE